ncbi:sodium:proton antiporter [Amycolatopsis rubida]|uniref:Sodium:proton antiporter n=1 Tax=Amycolatopsis rubida TaxID=112413 RepID=A0ABX0C136_9PSEU|nr:MULTISPECIES: MnhB domain-containing protein [Amycolatopsis]MYW94188.1 sodium:proton antiporter [Amycolatopsis rubida]NEC59177.1 sodium:proton antiporter [Amycolatopsis rubida]OAP20883.1 putative monovalent cation/H+ antiporter subunit B [Amycolatopsis sp. M39]
MRTRDVVGGVGLAGVAALFVTAFTRMPEAGAAGHLYRDLVLPLGFQRVTPNLVSSVNFDLRAFDTLGEETIVAAAVVGTLALLQPPKSQARPKPDDSRYVLPAVKLAGYLLLPVTVLLGLDIVVHGHLTPGGGFQGGVVLATGWHLLYLSGSYRALARLRPLDWCEYAEAAATGLYVVTGLVGLVVGGSFLANVLPLGEFGSLLSAGIVPVLSVLVGIEVAAGLVVLLSRFFLHGLEEDEP